MKLIFLSLILLASAAFAHAAIGAPPAPLQSYSIPPMLQDYSISTPVDRPPFHFDVPGKSRTDNGGGERFDSALELFQGGDYSGAAAAAKNIYKDYSGTVWEGRGAFLAARAYGAESGLLAL
ncbi:MAG: hypothetical protein ACYDFU_08600, partial [Nitrospirota bacterium]